MLQRPQYESEPREAANRFADALRKLEDIRAAADVHVEVAVRLLDVPVGAMHVEHLVHYGNPSAQKTA
jgi:hypothetical protein